MKTIKFGLIFSAVLSVCLFLFSCGIPSPKQESDIIADLTGKITSQQIDNQQQDLKITKLTIDKRQTNKNDKTDYVWCTVDMSNSNFSYADSYECYYTYYDKGGWILDNYVAVEPAEMRALSGVSSDVIDSLKTELMNTYATVSLDSQQTDIPNQKDVLTFKVDNKDNYSEVTGDVIIDYSFDGTEWEQGSVDQQTTQTISSGLNSDDVSALEQQLKQQYQTITQYTRNTDLENGTDDFVYDCVNKYQYCTETTEVFANYSYAGNGTNNWILNGGFQDGPITDDWNLKGTWDLSGPIFSMSGTDNRKITSAIIVNSCSEAGCTGSFVLTYPDGWESCSGTFDIVFSNGTDEYTQTINTVAMGELPFIEINPTNGITIWTFDNMCDNGYLNLDSFTPSN